MGWTFPRMSGIMWNAWSLRASSLSVKEAPFSGLASSNERPEVERVPHEEEGVMRLQR